MIGATWLDQQFIGDGKGLGDLGFSGDTRYTLHWRADFLAEHGLVQWFRRCVILECSLMDALRNRGLAPAARGISADAALNHRPMVSGMLPAFTGVRSC